jgi:flagellar motor switch protein FliG
MDKGRRMEMLEALARHDEEAAARVRKLLFLFEDLVRVSDRSLQSLLGEVDTRTLASALKGADETITGKVMNNLSTRAKASLKEEIGFLANVPPAKQKEARDAIAEVLGRMDAAGELVMEES